MKIICKKTDLAKAVQTVAKAVPAKATTSILECLLLRAEKEEITLTGNNLELGIETVMPGNIEEEGSIAIQAKVFGEIVRKLPEGDAALAAYGYDIKKRMEKLRMKVVIMYGGNELFAAKSVSLVKEKCVSECEVYAYDNMGHSEVLSLHPEKLCEIIRK